MKHNISSVTITTSFQSSYTRSIHPSTSTMHLVTVLLSGLALATTVYSYDSISFTTSSCPDCSHATGCSIETRSNMEPSFGCISMWSGDASLTVFDATSPSCQGARSTPLPISWSNGRMVRRASRGFEFMRGDKSEHCQGMLMSHVVNLYASHDCSGTAEVHQSAQFQNITPKNSFKITC